MEPMLKNPKTGFINQTSVNIIWWDFSRNQTRWNFSKSCGKFWRLYYNQTPGAKIELDGVWYELNHREIVVIPPLCTFSTRSSGSFSHLSIHFLAPDFMAGAKRKFYFFSTDIPAFSRMENAIETIESHEIQKELKMMTLYELVFAVIRNFNPDDCENEPKKQSDFRILKIVEEMSAHPEHIFQNHELSRRCGMSVNSFLRLFRKEFNMSPQHYSRVMRIEIARTMIWRNEYSLDEIAEATGFTDRYHFSKVFKAVTHCTPGQFRRFNSNTNMVSGAHLE